MRRRGRNPNENPGVRPVERIELSEKNTKRRVIASIILLLFGVSMMAYAMHSCMSETTGWREISVTESSAESVASDLIFQYELGASGMSPTAENKAVSMLYTSACKEAYRLFSANSYVLGVNNLYYINTHIGEEITVDPALYAAFALLAQYGDRTIYMTPFYTDYYNLFSCVEDYETAEFDPYQSEEVSAYFAKASSFINDENAVQLHLLGENKVKLTVSEEYLAFAEENGIERFIDFYWMRNAFAVDYVADKLIEAGYTYGNITSYDGFTRNLDTRPVTYSLNLFHLLDDTVYAGARLDYSSAKSMVFLRAYSLTELDDTYYRMADGTYRHAYIDPADGFCKNSVNELYGYAKDKSCAEIMLSLVPAFISENLDTAYLAKAGENQIYSVYFDGTEVCYNEKTAVFGGLFANDDLSFTLKPWS